MDGSLEHGAQNMKIKQMSQGMLGFFTFICEKRFWKHTKTQFFYLEIPTVEFLENSSIIENFRKTWKWAPV